MFDLPEHLAERCRLANSIEELHSEGPVIVWLKSSLRTHENPALDAGRIIADDFHDLCLCTKASMSVIHTQTLGTTTFSSMLPSTCTMDANNWELTTLCTLQEKDNARRS